MTVLEFWGCALITFGPALAMFSLTVAHDPIKIILLISSSFFWLLSFLLVAVFWAVISQVCDYLIIGAYLAVISQEAFRYLFHLATKRAQIYLARLLNNEGGINKHTSRANEIQLNQVETYEFQDRLPLSYVSGLGFGLMNAAFSLMNVLTDYIGPGTVGLKGDSSYFLLVSSLTALAFLLLNVAWSILMSESVEKSDKKLALVVLVSHLTATTITFINRAHLQLLSMVVVYTITIICGFGAFRVAGLEPRQLLAGRQTSRRPAST